ncbi:hypothetical protein [Microcystis phage Mwe-JY26]
MAISLTHRQRLLLIDMLNAGSGPEMYFTFAGLKSITLIDHDSVPQTVRDLARMGLAEYRRGLWTEDGTPGGSGYGLTELGLSVAKVERDIEAALHEEK